MASRLDFIQRANAGYIEAQYERYRQDPASVPEEWALFFAGFDLAAPPGLSRASGGPASGVYGLVQNYREFGHLIARLDPLGHDPRRHPLLELATAGVNDADLAAPTDGLPFKGEFKGTVADLLEALRATYSGTLGVEYMDIADKDRREWLQARMEPRRNRPELDADQRRGILRRLLTADAFEQFLNVKYPGQKRFSLEGAASLIPMLDTIVAAAAHHELDQVAIGMPHRGRINVLANILHKPLELIFSEFESGFVPEHVQGHGDVKYHLGYSAQHDASTGRSLHLDLTFNPSHLEFVNPVVLGLVRARQEQARDHDGVRGLPLLIHGDASFSGEGIVAETLMMAPLPHYRTGGTLHIIVNNQIGFTTSPEDARLGRYPTDIARVVNAPVIHVNGDDPEAAVYAAELAFAYRAEFHEDVIVDLVCYRRHGHNELDDPTFTQPVMYREIAAHVPASRQYAERLLSERIVDAAGLAAMEAEIEATFQAAHRRARTEVPHNGEVVLGGAWSGLEWAGDDWSADTAVPTATIERVVQALAQLPDGFHAHPKVRKLAADRLQMVREDRMDWALGEALAIGSLLVEGRHVRMSGQDTGRGTFSHRHAVLHDVEDGRLFVPLQHLSTEQGRFEIFDTPLSEAAVLGFEYGFSTADPHTLVIWEAQFGDFGNVAQVFVDQFLASGESKWRRMSGLSLLLPHGYEGQGPEHSSARLERFLELCANGNMQVCNLTTPAQLFHALRRQLLRRFRKPLVIMSPKSLLRHKLAVSPVRDFVNRSFQTVIDDAGVTDPAAVRRVLLVSGKIAYALQEARAAVPTDAVAIVRIEQLYPFPHAELDMILRRYPNARDLRWVQEEPANMGAWRSTRHRLEAVMPDGTTLRLVARKASPTPATGYYHMHVEQERTLLERAFADPGGARKPRGAASIPVAGGRQGGTR
jgi:2-oxoglutarate dehydrogenase E1 component